MDEALGYLLTLFTLDQVEKITKGGVIRYDEAAIVIKKLIEEDGYTPERILLDYGLEPGQSSNDFCVSLWLFGRDLSFLDTGKWIVDEDGVSYLEKKRGEEVSFQVSPIPILPTALVQSMETGEERVELSFYRRGRWSEIIVPRSTIANKGKIVELSDRGVEVSSSSAGRLSEYLCSTIAKSLKTIPFKHSSSSLGWHGGEFAPYSGGILFDGDESYKGLFDAVRERGSLEDWKAFIAPLRKNTVFRLFMAASFASPLISLIGENPFIFHLWGGTGAGKTVALLAAMSIWGDPSSGKLTRSMNMTANSMLQTAAILKNIPFGGDELQTIKNNFDGYDKMLMQVAEGIDRGRMRYDKLLPTRHWSCAFLFTGEEPCTRSSSGGGVFNRVIEVECKGKVVEDGHAAANFVRANYGTAGRPFIDAVKGKDLRPRYRELRDGILDAADTTEKQAGAMALLLLADEIASDLFWPGEESGIPAEEYMQFLRSEGEVDAAERAYQYIMDQIASNGKNFVEEGHPCEGFQAWGKMDDEKGVFFINSILSDKLREAGFDLRAVKNKWLERGYLRQGHGGRFRHSVRIGKAVASCSYICLQPQSGPAPIAETVHELPF